MLRLVIRQLQLDPLRTALTGLALAGVVAVILLFEGFLGGVIEQSRQAVLKRGADLVVTQAGVGNLTLARSVLPQFTRDEVESVQGVAAAHPLTSIPVIYERDGERTPLLLFVYQASGGPAQLAMGERIDEPREIVVDESFSDRYDLRVGDPLTISGFEFRISGIAEDAAAFFSSFGFIRYDDLIDFYFESDLAADISTFPLLSFLLVQLAPGADAEVIAASIEQQVPGVAVFVPTELAERDARLGQALLGPIIGLLVMAGYISGALVIGIIMFAAVNGRRRDLGVLKALGFSNGFLILAEIVEALVLVIAALPLGLVLAQMIAMGIEFAMPLYLLPVAEATAVARTVVAALVFGVVGALLPLQLIRRLDPGSVFRS